MNRSDCTCTTWCVHVVIGALLLLMAKITCPHGRETPNNVQRGREWQEVQLKAINVLMYSLADCCHSHSDSPASPPHSPLLSCPTVSSLPFLPTICCRTCRPALLTTSLNVISKWLHPKVSQRAVLFIIYILVPTEIQSPGFCSVVKI